MNKISMEIPRLKADSSKWLQLENECIEIVNLIDNQLENISNDALKTPMLKNEFDKLREIYMQIERTLTANINTINSFFEDQFKKYDKLGYDISNVTDEVGSRINVDASNVSGTIAGQETNIANQTSENLGINFNAENVQKNKQVVENQTINDNSLANPLENVGNETIKAGNKDITYNLNADGLANSGNEELLDSIGNPKAKMNLFDNVSDESVELEDIYNVNNS